MGKQIAKVQLHQSDVNKFTSSLQSETSLLRKWVQNSLLSETPREIGFELECWLVDDKMQPVTGNLKLIKLLSDRHFVPEVAKSTLEINTDPLPLNGLVFSEHGKRMQQWLNQIEQSASLQNRHIIYAGSLPSAQKKHFNQQFVTPLARYKALQKRIDEVKNHLPYHLDIQGHEESLSLQTHSIAIGGIASAFHMHVRIGMSQSARYYNAAQILSAPLLAVGCNSPTLFGSKLWAESRIAVLEQLFFMPNHCAPQYPSRAFFGKKYLQHSMLELFIENQKKFDPLLPVSFDTAPEIMRHLQLHNSTVYRWNRPVMEFDKSGQAHFRIEHRALPAGPSVVDMMANTALLVGLIEFYANDKTPLETQLPFRHARQNFHHAAQSGLEATMIWTENRLIQADELILKILLPRAFEGLQQLGINVADAQYYLDIIKARTERKATGSQWQLQFLEKNASDYNLLAQEYLKQQQTGRPVHEWGT